MQTPLLDRHTQTIGDAGTNGHFASPPAPVAAALNAAHDPSAFCADATRLAALVCDTPISALLLPSEGEDGAAAVWRLSCALPSVPPVWEARLTRLAERIAEMHERGGDCDTVRPGEPSDDANDDDTNTTGFWAGVGLYDATPRQTLAGVLCVADTNARPEGLTPAQTEGLEALARQTAVLLALAPVAAAAAETRRQWEEADARAHHHREEAHAAHLHAAYVSAQATAQTAHAQADKKRFCHDVIRCVTQGRFRLAEENEFPDDGAVAMDATVRAPEEYPLLRGRLRTVLLNSGMEPTAAGDFLVAIGEAVTNSLKHAQGGQCTVKITPDMVRVRVCDDGPGIAPNALPDTILKAGYSTKASLGMGFTLMLEMADAVWLATDEGDGAAIQLEKWIRPDARPSSDIPELSAWDTL